MAQRQQLSAQKRENTAAKSRRLGFIPGILYGPGQPNQLVEVDSKTFQKVFRQAGLTSIITLQVGEQEYPVVIREVQTHPVKQAITHIDFYQVRMDKVMRIHVPLSFVGTAAAVKDLGGVLVRNSNEVEVDALPQDMPHEIEVDISALNTFEAVIHMADIKVPAGVKILEKADDVVALVQAPRSEEELKALAEEVKEDVESVEGVKKEEKLAEGETATEEKTTEKADKKEIKT